MGYILTLPAKSTTDPSLMTFYQRLSLEYATLRTNYGISLSEPMILALCTQLGDACNCRKTGFQQNKPSKTTSIKFSGQNGASITVVVSPDQYADGKSTNRPCPSCGVAYDGKANLGGLNWTNAHNVVNHGKMDAALRKALADALQQGTTPDARLAAPSMEVKEVITFVIGRAEGYKGPAATFGAGQQCPVCEKIHASDSLLQRHERCKLHKGTYNYRSIKIEGKDYIRGNECIVGMQFGATRAVPEGDLVRLKAYTSSMAGKIANEVIETLTEIYDKQETKYDQPFVTDLLLAIDRLTWAVRKRLIEACQDPLGALPPDRNQVVLVAPVIPDPVVIPPLPVSPYTPAKVAPTAPSASSATSAATATPWVPRTPAANDFKAWNMYIGSLKQRLRRAPYATQGLETMKRVRGYDATLLPDLAKQPDDRERLSYMLEQFWKAFKDKKMSEPVFTELTQNLSRIGFDRAPGAQINRTKVELGNLSQLTGRQKVT